MKKLVVVLSVALIALGGGAIFLWRQLDAERALNADLQARMKVLESAPRTLASLFGPRAQPASTTGEAQAPAVPVDPAAARAKRQQDVQQAVARVRENLAKPETRQAMAGMVRGFLPMMLPDLAKELNLSPAETEKLMDLFAKQTDGALGQLGGTASLQDMAGNAQQMQQANDAQIAALLGDKYPAWQTYQATLPMRTQVNQLQNTLAASGNKLTDAQTGPLITALSAEQKRITQDRPAPTPNMTPQERMQQRQQQTASNNQRLVTAATPYMTPQQLDAYKASLERPANGLAGMLGGMGGMAGRMGGQGGAAAPPR